MLILEPLLSVYRTDGSDHQLPDQSRFPDLPLYSVNINVMLNSCCRFASELVDWLEKSLSDLTAA